MKYIRILLSIFLVFIFTNVVAQDVLTIEIEALIKKTMNENNLPGLAISIVDHDSLIFAKGYGTRKIGETDPMDRHTLFQAASLTKTFTVTLMGILVDQGKVKWDDPVKEHITDFNLQEDYITDRLTIRDILSVRSGIINGDKIQATSREELISLLVNQPISNSFRLKQTSFNLNYSIAGYIEEIIYNKSWEDIIKNTLFDPLEMNESFTNNSMAINYTKNISIPHLFKQGEIIPTSWDNYELFAPAACIVTNVMDLAKWMKLLLNNGELGDVKIIKDETLKQIQSSQIIVNGLFKNICNPSTNFMTFGLGWFISDYKGNKIIEMEGAVPGTSNIMALIPSIELGLVIHTNSNFAFKSLLPIKFSIFEHFISKSINH